MAAIVKSESLNAIENSGLSSPETNSKRERGPGLRASMMNWRQQAKRVQEEARVFYFAFKHPKMPWYARLVALCTVGYLLSPVQLIPSFIPVIGFLDDLLVLSLGVKLLRRITPPDLLTECRKVTDKTEMRRRQGIMSPAIVVVVADDRCG